MTTDEARAALLALWPDAEVWLDRVIAAVRAESAQELAALLDRWDGYNGDSLMAELHAPAAATPAEPCTCGGRRWVDDENWTPDDPRTWRGERSKGDGLIPCGFCNEGGWDTPEYAATPAEDGEGRT